MFQEAKIMNRKLIVVVPILLAATAAMSIWLSGFNLSGSFLATSGTKPDIQTAIWNIDISSDDDVNNSFTYNNADGSKDVVLTLTDGLTSTDLNCIYEPDKDVVFYLNATTPDNNPTDYCHLTATNPCVLNMRSGDNKITVKVTPNPNRCSLQGNYSIGFVV